MLLNSKQQTANSKQQTANSKQNRTTLLRAEQANCTLFASCEALETEYNIHDG